MLTKSSVLNIALYGTEKGISKRKDVRKQKVLDMKILIETDVKVR